MKIWKKLGCPWPLCVESVSQFELHWWSNISAILLSALNILLHRFHPKWRRSNRCFNCSSVCDALFNYVNTNTEPEQLVGWMEWWYFNYQLAFFLFTPQSSLDLISFQIFCSSDQVKKGKAEQRIKGHWSFPLVFHKS